MKSIKPKLSGVIAAIAVVVYASAVGASAQIVLNSDFSGGQSGSGGNGGSVTPPTDWTYFYATGVIQPATYVGVDGTPAHAASGFDQSAYDSTQADTYLNGLYQTVTVALNTNYTLTGYIDGDDSTGTFGVDTSASDVSSGTLADVLASTPYADTSSGGTDSAAFDQYTVTFNSGANTSLTVFTAFIGGYNSGNGEDFNEDGIQITPTAAPEPSTYALLFAGGLGLFLLARRKNARV